MKSFLQKRSGKNFANAFHYLIITRSTRNGGIEHSKGYPMCAGQARSNISHLSSGTSEAASKYIPITNDLMRGNRMMMIKQLISLRTYHDIPVRSLGKGWLMFGGSTDLEKGPGYYAGDLSGITAKKVPFWFNPFYKPGKKIAEQKTGIKRLIRLLKKLPTGISVLL